MPSMSPLDPPRIKPFVFSIESFHFFHDEAFYSRPYGKDFSQLLTSFKSKQAITPPYSYKYIENACIKE